MFSDAPWHQNRAGQLKVTEPAARIFAVKIAVTSKAMKKKGHNTDKKNKTTRSSIARGKGARATVLRGAKVKTAGGLTRETLVKSKKGKAVSKARSERSKEMFDQRLGRWGAAVKLARTELGIKGFCPVGGKTAQGQALLALVRTKMSGM